MNGVKVAKSIKTFPGDKKDISTCKTAATLPRTGPSEPTEIVPLRVHVCAPAHAQALLEGERERDHNKSVPFGVKCSIS